MPFLKRSKIGWGLFIALMLGGLTGCGTSGRVIGHGIPDVYDYQIFPSAKLEKADQPFEFFKVPNITLPPAFLFAFDKKNNVGATTTAEQFFADNDCLAFIIIRNDTILYENYFNGHTRESISQVFSVTKAFVSTLVGIAVSEGKMQLSQPVSDFLPYFNKGMQADITIDHLLQMTSGLKFTDYKTFGKLLQLYYNNNSEKMIANAKVKYQPGTHFAYSSMATQILGMCLEKAINMPVAKYMQEKLWKPLGMEFDGQIAVENGSGREKFFGGVAARPIDLAKFGRLFLNKGNWQGNQLVPEWWARSSRQRNECEGSSWRYTNCWWLDTYSGMEKGQEKDDFFAGGFRGQIIYVNPDENMIMIRVGTSESKVNWPYTMSKLSIMPIGPQENDLNEQLLTSLDGKYKNKAGKLIEISFKDDKAFINDPSDQTQVELVKEAGFSFVNHQKKVKLIVNYRNQKINGLIYEAGSEVGFYQKM
ncbi:MAG: serine hydrolase [Chitinophagales bacterium]|nr:serine hydrolase [Chitinophagales bacterium]